MFSEFLTWWAQRMLEVIRWRVSPGAERSVGLIVATRMPLEGALIVELLFGGRHREGTMGLFALSQASFQEGMSGGVAEFREVIRRYQRAAANITLRLPENVFLHRQVTLPLLAERAPERVLEFEMDRLTPFSSDEVVWTWSVASRDPVRGELRLNLAFVPRSRLTTLLTTLEQAGAVPTMVEISTTSDSKRRIALRPVEPGTVQRQRWGLALVGGVCAVLAIVAIVMPFELQSSARRAVEARFARLSPGVARVEEVRREMASRIAGHDVFAAEQVRVGNTLEILGALTDMLPDETFLTGLTLRQKKLTMEGQSAAAARLITVLSENRVIRDPAFAAPVTRVENGHADQFSIRAEVAP